jgi:hypothetical protein
LANKKLAFSWANFSAFLNRPLTFFVCAPLVLTLIGIFAFRFQPTDPDIWWHLNVGRDILQGGIRQADIYSYTLPGYQWVDHEWSLNLIMFLLFTGQNNFVLLAFIWGAVTFTAFYALVVNSLAKPLSSEGQIATWLSLVLGFMACLTCLGIRAQTVSILGFACVWLLLQKNGWPFTKWALWLVPLGFTLWANLHGGFVLGLGLLSLDIANDLFLVKPEARVIKQKLIILALSFCASLINPYGFGLYHEFWAVFTDAYAHATVDEWRQLDLQKYKFVYLIFYLLGLAALYLKNSFYVNKLKISTFKIVLSLLLLLCAFKSVRHLPFFVLASLPIFAELLEAELIGLSLKLPKAFAYAIFGLGLLGLMVATNFAAVQARANYLANIQEKQFYKSYPVKALQFIKAKGLKGNLMAQYTWGGFIPWYQPGQKVFIDGRMPSWKKKGHSTILKEFNKVIHNEPESFKILQKYKVKYILLYRSSNLCRLYPGWEPIYQDTSSVLLAPQNKKGTD